MKKFTGFSMSGVIAAAVISASLSVVTAGPAMAQSGSRLCGWSAPTPTGYIGILYEARQKDASYTKQCNEAIDKINATIQGNPQLKALTWTKHNKATCESVGNSFMSSNSQQDMCEKMTAKEPYQVVKTNATNTTTYTKM
ncbi:MAG: hypothetical protein ACK46Q_11875 [Hyphomonas sp.]